ncbi:MAG: hypothetical protein NZ990_05940 [Myxococcota bacterium]|nr:hypothetical protein [Myxococcota bacterium]
MRGERGESAILFAEVPDFYAEVESRAAPELRGGPVLVGGDPAKRGRVLSLNSEARRAGVERGMAMAAALASCPDATWLPTNMKRYREASGALVNCLRGVFDEVEKATLGSVYADVHGEAGTPERVAEQLLPRAGAELGLPLRVGIAPSKFLARLAAEEAGVGAVHRVPHAEIASFLAPLPVSRLPKVGKKTAARLAELGARRVADVVELGAALLEEEFGNHGLRILEMARGQDRSPMRVAALPKSVGRETTFPAPTGELQRLAAEAEKLAESAAAALERQGLRAGRVALRLIDTRGATTTRSVTLREPILGAAEIYRVALDLLRRDHDPEIPHRGLGITLAGLHEAAGEDRQLDLFGAPGREGRLKAPRRGSEGF